MIPAHSKLAPSSANKWVHCSGYVGMVATLNLANDDSDTRDGSAAHEIAEALIWAYLRGVTETPKIAGMIASNGVVLTLEILDGAALFAATCLRIIEFLVGF